MASTLGSAPPMAACAHSPAACRPHASNSVARSRPVRPGITRRAGSTIQLVVASRNSPAGLRNGTRSHWKRKRASSKNTMNVTSVSTRKMPIWASTSVLPELPAELFAALACRLDRAQQPLGEPLFVDHLERRLGGAALRGHLLSQFGRRLVRGRRELRGAEHRLHGKLERGLARNAE